MDSRHGQSDVGARPESIAVNPAALSVKGCRFKAKAPCNGALGPLCALDLAAMSKMSVV
jgi:hypothetical protein